MKFVVWGCGLRGRLFINSKLHGEIVAIIENDKALQGNVYEDINIISPEIYLNEYKNYPVLVTPANAEKEIIQQLNEAGIYWAFSLTDEWTSILGLFQQLSIDDMISNYDQKETIGIWGYSVLGLFLYDFLCNRGFSCVMLLNNIVNEDIKRYLENILNIKLASKEICQANHNRILLATPMSEHEKVFFTGNKIEKYYNLELEKERFFNPYIETYKSIHRGKRCFIVATGPSLSIKDLETLHKNKEICISVNGIFAAFADTFWRPDYYIINDPIVMKKWKSQIINLNAKGKFISDMACEHPEELGIKWHAINLLIYGESMDFSDDFAHGAFLQGTITHAALQLAVYMGFTEIYLLGVDCNYEKGSTNNHFYKEKMQDGTGTANTDFMRNGYSSIRSYTDSHGIKVYNATRGGMLEVFERVDFDSLF